MISFKIFLFFFFSVFFFSINFEKPMFLYSCFLFFSVFHEKRNTEKQVSSIRNNQGKNYARLTYAQLCLSLFDPEHVADESRDSHGK